MFTAYLVAVFFGLVILVIDRVERRRVMQEMQAGWKLQLLMWGIGILMAVTLLCIPGAILNSVYLRWSQWQLKKIQKENPEWLSMQA